MRLLPTTLWLFIAAQIEAQHAQLPTAIRRMAPDDGAKFFPEYYAFADEGQPGEYAQALFAEEQDVPRAATIARRAFDEEDARLLAANASAQLSYRPPFAPHTLTDEDEIAQRRRISGDETGEEEEDRQSASRAWSLYRRSAEALGQLEKRQWACPNGTSSCSSIGYPDSCCTNGETCVIVVDTGLGNVGCCPSGSTCGGTVGDCTSGSTACSSSQGGGCCISGYVCEGVGCVQSSSTAAAGTATGVLTLTSLSTSTVDSPTLSTVIVTVIITLTPTQSETTSTTTQVVGGGAGGGASTATQTTTSKDGAVPPVRPTSSTSPLSTYCPTGFYACVASAGGGCCQTGRDCNTTSCPAQAYTTLVNSNGVTIVVPESIFPTTTSRCASGWFMCGSAAGAQAGCCPSGYNCGTASCSLVTVGGTATIAKEPPSSVGTRGTALGSQWRMLVAAIPVVLFLVTLI